MTQPSLLDLPPTDTPKENAVAKEKRRIGKNAWRVLKYLQTHGSATNHELSQPEVGGLAAIRRVWDLTRDGWIIEKTHVGGGIFSYRLVGHK